MPSAVPIVLGAWLPLTLLLFRALAPRRAALASLIGGWLLLPTAWYPADTARSEFPYWILPASLPAEPWLTKAAVIGLATLLGVALFDRKAMRRFRPSWFDLPMLGWCLWPAASGLANGLGGLQAAAMVAYHALAWGVPYLIGRLYCHDSEGRDDLAMGIVLGGLAYVPACLVENVAGPWLYAFAYGFHPYRTPGMNRYLGYRPIVFLEDGNQLGIWMATAAAVAYWLWRSGRLPGYRGVPGGAFAAILIGAALLTQSAGAVLLLLAALAGLEAVRWAGKPWPLVAPLGLVPILVAAQALNLVDAKALAQKTGAGRAAIASLQRLDRQSFGWRLRVEERQARMALERPVTGWGRWDWWRLRGGEERSWGLPGLVLGMYGLPGWGLLVAMLALPIARFLIAIPAARWGSAAMASAAALAAALTINALDAILNGAYLLPLAAAGGGLAVIADSPPPKIAPAPGPETSPHKTYRIGRP